MHGPPDLIENSRIFVYAAVLALCCLLSTGSLLLKAPVPGHLSDPGQVAQRSDARFATLRAALPRTGVVGYIGESGPVTLGDYYLTEYALTPLVVDYSVEHAIVVGNFPSETSPKIPANLHLIRDFGHGVLLLGNEGAK